MRMNRRAVLLSGGGPKYAVYIYNEVSNETMLYGHFSPEATVNVDLSEISPYLIVVDVIANKMSIEYESAYPNDYALFTMPGADVTVVCNEQI